MRYTTCAANDNESDKGDLFRSYGAGRNLSHGTIIKITNTFLFLGKRIIVIRDKVTDYRTQQEN